MKLADKPVYACVGDSISQNYLQEGLTFRERLIIALASNPAIPNGISGIFADSKEFQEQVANVILSQADAIIAEMEK